MSERIFVSKAVFARKRRKTPYCVHNMFIWRSNSPRTDLLTACWSKVVLFDMFKIHVQSHLCAVKPKAQCDWLTSDYTYELELERRCMFNWSFLPMDSTNSNVLFRFDVLLHSRLFCFCNKHRWHMQIYATNETRTFSVMDDHVERSVLTSIKTKTVRIKSPFFQVRKFCKSYSSYM